MYQEKPSSEDEETVIIKLHSKYGQILFLSLSQNVFEQLSVALKDVLILWFC